MAMAIAAVLASLAFPLYWNYVERAQLAQLLVQIDQIGTAVHIEDATEVRQLQRDAVPGKSPPLLAAVPDTSFNESGGIRLLLIRAPAGFFASSPAEARYGLIADLPASAGTDRLAQLRYLLPFADGDKLWLASNQLAFPLSTRATDGDTAQPPAPSTPVTAWEGTGVAGANGTWACQATLSVYGTDGKLLTGVNAGVRIKVVLGVTTWNGSPIERSWTDLGNLSGGKTSFAIDRLSAQASNGETVTSCRLEVTGIDYYWPQDPPIKWSGNMPSVEIKMPTPAAQAACQPSCK